MMRVQWNEKDYCGRQAYLDIDVIADANPGDRTVAGGSAFLWPHLSDLVTGVLCHASAPDGIQEKQINHLCAIYAAEVNRKDSLCKPRIEHMQVIEGLWLGASEEPDRRAVLTAVIESLGPCVATVLPLDLYFNGDDEFCPFNPSADEVVDWGFKPLPGTTDTFYCITRERQKGHFESWAGLAFVAGLCGDRIPSITAAELGVN
jgi:hypothetical protein